MSAPVRVGDVIKVGEPDYCYGVGDLVLRITAFIETDLPVSDWIALRGVELAWNGAEKGERQVLVRRQAIARQANR